MYGPPGCGKTMLAKAVAAHTTASFIRVVGSEFVQKYLGEGEILFFLLHSCYYRDSKNYSRIKLVYADIRLFSVSRTTHGA